MRVLAAALAVSTILCAQGLRMSIAGVLLDPMKRPVPDAKVVLRSSVDERTTMTSATGEFRFDNLAPGSYRLRVVVRGFDPIERTVRAGQKLTLELVLSRLKEELTVAGEAVRVNTDAASNADAVAVDRSLLDHLPALDQDYVQTLARFLDPGAAAAGGPSIIVDGMEMRNAGVTASAIREIKINQNPYTAEYPLWSRRRIEILTSAGADRYHGTFNFVFRDHHLNAREAFARVRPPEQRRIFEGSLLGPIGSGKNSSFLLTGTREAEDLQTVVFAQGLAGPVIENAPTPSHNTYVSARINHQFNERHVVFWQQNYQDRFQYNVGVGGTVLPEAGTHNRLREDEHIINHRGVITPKLLTQFRILIARYWQPIESNTPRPRFVVSDAFTGGGAEGDMLRTEFHTAITWILTQTTRKHTLKYGINVPDWSRRGMKDQTNRLGTFYYGSLGDFAQNQPFAAVVERGDPKVIFVEKNVGGFFQDEWLVRPNLSISAGLRYDWQSHFGDTNNWSPRMAVAWAPPGGKKFVIRAGGGIFYHRTGPGPIWDLLRFNGVHLRRYVLSGPQIAVAADDAALATLPTSVVRLDPRVGLPQIMQVSAGVERQLSMKTTLAVQYVGIRGTQQLRSRDANAPPPPDFAARPDPRISVLRQIESAGRLQSDALEITLRGTLAPKVAGVAQYNFGKTMSDTGGANWFPANSFDPRGEWGRADTDRRHQFNFMGTATLHRWANFGASISLLTGPPFNITTGRDDNHDGLANDRPPGVTRNTGQGPGYAGVDLRWYREWRWQPARKDKSPMTTISVDAFNALNRVNYQNYLGAMSSPFFGKAVGAQAPRRLQVGVRYQF